MNEFVYLFRCPPAAAPSPQQMQERMQRWSAWFKVLEKKGNLVNIGQPLERAQGTVVKDAKGTLTDGPYAETKDIVIGYSLVKASGLDQATALAADCPIFEQGGMVEVRPVLKM
jgi:hypothetical protein